MYCFHPLLHLVALSRARGMVENASIHHRQRYGLQSGAMRETPGFPYRDLSPGYTHAEMPTVHLPPSPIANEPRPQGAGNQRGLTIFNIFKSSYAAIYKQTGWRALRPFRKRKTAKQRIHTDRMLTARPRAPAYACTSDSHRVHRDWRSHRKRAAKRQRGRGNSTPCNRQHIRHPSRAGDDAAPVGRARLRVRQHIRRSHVPRHREPRVYRASATMRLNQIVTVYGYPSVIEPKDKAHVVCRIGPMLLRPTWQVREGRRFHIQADGDTSVPINRVEFANCHPGMRMTVAIPHESLLPRVGSVLSSGKPRRAKRAG